MRRCKVNVCEQFRDTWESAFMTPGIGVHDAQNRFSPSDGIGVVVRPESLFMVGPIRNDVYMVCVH
jgi:hypothetical protein